MIFMFDAVYIIDINFYVDFNDETRCQIEPLIEKIEKFSTFHMPKSLWQMAKSSVFSTPKQWQEIKYWISF